MITCVLFIRGVCVILYYHPAACDPEGQRLAAALRSEQRFLHYFLPILTRLAFIHATAESSRHSGARPSFPPNPANESKDKGHTYKRRKI